MLNNPATRDVGGLTYRRREDGDVIITEYFLKPRPFLFAGQRRVALNFAGTEENPVSFSCQAQLARTTKMRLTRSLYSLLVCSVVFSGGGLAAVGEEDDGSFHVNSWVVEVHAGEGHAAQLAEKHGFIKHGQVRAPRWVGVPV